MLALLAGLALRLLARRIHAESRPGVAAYYFELLQREVPRGGLGMGRQLGPLLRLIAGLRQLL